MKKRIIALILAFVMVGTLAACGTGTENPGDEEKDEGAALVSDDWWAALPYESWSQFEQVDVGDDWFEVYELPGNVYAIYEDGQWENVISYLIIGEEKALLWDTGMGIGDIKAVADKLTELPYFVLLSHRHRDHIGGMHQFEEVWCYDSEYTVEYLTNGLPNEHEEVQSEIAEGMIWKETPEGFDPDTYSIVGKAPSNTVKEGDVIDLGNRKLEVIHTPGHTADSIMLIDEENGILFTGDTFYPDDLYAFSEDSDLEDYAATMRKVADKIADMDIEWLYTSHLEVVKGAGVLQEIANHMEAILNGKKTDFETDEEGLRYYTFDDGIRIITLG